MLTITLLGTAATMPLPDRALTAALAECGGHALLFDCGEGTQAAARRAGVNLMKLDAICLTHYHGDHIFGLPGLLQTLGCQGRERPLTLYGPEGLGEVWPALRTLADRLQYLRKLEQRKSEILSAIESQGKLTPELTEKIQKAETLVETEDLYLPYRPKRKTRASMAIARGLEPLARTLMAQDAGTDPVQAAQAFLTEEVPDTDAALQGAMDILAEEMANDADLRKQMRRLVMLTGTLQSHAVDADAETLYQNYYDYAEPV